MSTAQALRDLIRAELAHERDARTDQARAAELEQQVSQAREHYRRLAGLPSDAAADQTACTDTMRETVNSR